MPLLLTALTGMPGLPGAGGRPYPDNVDQAATEWRTAVAAWTVGVVPPSTAVGTAVLGLEAELAVVFRMRATPETPHQVVDALEQAFAVFARRLALGMVGYQAVAPPGPVGFRQLFQPPFPTSRQAAIDAIAQRLDVWARTGTATMLAPPYTFLFWS